MKMLQTILITLVSFIPLTASSGAVITVYRAQTSDRDIGPQVVYFTEPNDKDCVAPFKALKNLPTHIRVETLSPKEFRDPDSRRLEFCKLKVPEKNPLIMSAMITSKTVWDSLEEWDGAFGRIYSAIKGSAPVSIQVEEAIERFSRRILNPEFDTAMPLLDAGDVLVLAEDAKSMGVAEHIKAYQKKHFPDAPKLVVKTGITVGKHDCSDPISQVLHNTSESEGCEWKEHVISIHLDNEASDWKEFIGERQFDTVLMRLGLCTCGSSMISCGGIGEKQAEVDRFMSNVLASLKPGGRAVLHGGKDMCKKTGQYASALSKLTTQMKISRTFESGEFMYIYLEKAK